MEFSDMEATLRRSGPHNGGVCGESDPCRQRAQAGGGRCHQQEPTPCFFLEDSGGSEAGEL